MGRSSRLAREQAEAARQLAEAQLRVAEAFERSKSAVMGWAQAGLAGTTWGERLLFQQQLLRREITQLFLPAIEKVSQWLDQLILRFQRLTGEQQQAIGKWLMTGTAMLGTLVILPRVIAAVEGLAKSWKALTLVVSANPFLLAAAGLTVLMARTEEGRQSLAEMGRSALAAFEELAELLSNVLTPALDLVSEFLSGTLGKIITWSAVFVTAVYAVKAAFASLALTMLGAGAIVAGLVLAVGLLAAAFGKSEFQKFSGSIARQVAQGKLTLEQARQEIEAKAAGEAFERREELSGRRGIRGGLTGGVARLGGFDPEEIAEAERREKVRRANEEAERAAKGKRRQELMLAQTGQEDVRSTINRIQTAALKVDTGKETAKNTEMTAKATREILERLTRLLGGKVDNQEKPPKGD